MSEQLQLQRDIAAADRLVSLILSLDRDPSCDPPPVRRWHMTNAATKLIWKIREEAENGKSD